MAEVDRLAELEKLLVTLWSAVGTGESTAGLAREIRSVLAEIEAVSKATPTQGSGLDELERKRAARQSNSQRRATPTRKRG
jgi:hypothetical protein